MLQHIDINKIIFLDIETVPLEYEFKNLPKRSIDLWDKKTKYIQRYQEIDAEQAYSKAGIYAEFGKIVCISAGYVTQEKKEQKLRIKSFFGKDEKKLLRGFNSLLNKTLKENYLLCAHNGKEFDFPFIGRRNLINGLTLPAQLDIAGKKPWEIPHLDTMELWKFGDYKHFTSLDLLAHVFNIPSPKQDLDGSMVAKTYYEENDLEKIKNYCQNDVITIAQLLLKYKGKGLISSDNIEIIS
ncbi:MAG: 3'-5' exonuclease [Flavobacteriales bacterium]